MTKILRKILGFEDANLRLEAMKIAENLLNYGTIKELIEKTDEIYRFLHLGEIKEEGSD